MPGKILAVKVVEGEVVEDGQTLVLLEAMKMENALTAEGQAPCGEHPCSRRRPGRAWPGAGRGLSPIEDGR